jgi:hypothetical protein
LELKCRDGAFQIDAIRRSTTTRAFYAQGFIDLASSEKMTTTVLVPAM